MTQWNSLEDFWRMGGYGLYVWGSYAVTLLCMLAEPLLARQRHARALAALRQSRRDAAEAAALRAGGRA